ncbi:MAG TPA: cupin domain-containing protein, partial [Gammaproteobacteria bacterium]|nr:cupin domain-containing protein [Gammaproteobacteria bacterium]
MKASSPFGELTPAGFLQRYWQKRPLVVRGALPQLAGIIDPEELAGLACEPDVASRIVRGDGEHEPFTLEHGPFSEQQFRALPERDWTVLVQDVEKHLPEMAGILAPFRFLPDWRIDDLMISYAAPGGSAGPHVDQYDVFLVQASGERHWAVQEAADAICPVKDSPLRLVANFAPTSEWLLEAGDLLYLPPGIPHHGVA